MLDILEVLGTKHSSHSVNQTAELVLHVSSPIYDWLKIALQCMHVYKHTRYLCTCECK